MTQFIQNIKEISAVNYVSMVLIHSGDQASVIILIQLAMKVRQRRTTGGSQI